MRRAFCALGLLLLAGCGGAPPATNDAVVACEQQAEKQGFDVGDQQSVTPLGQGRYAIVLDVTGDKGDLVKHCDYDPRSGAHIRQASN